MEGPRSEILPQGFAVSGFAGGFVHVSRRLRLACPASLSLALIAAFALTFVFWLPDILRVWGLLFSLMLLLALAPLVLIASPFRS